MSCLEIKPAPECGLNGECIVDNGTSFCKCDSGWSQTLEFNYFVSEGSLTSSVCIYNQAAVDGLYITLVGVAVFDTLLQLLVTKKWSSFKKRIPWFAFTILIIALSSYRLSNSDALFGVDVAFTFLLSICWMFAYIQGGIQLSKYLHYLKNKFDYEKTETYFRRSVRKGHDIITVVGSLSQNLYWISALNFIHTESALVLVRIGFGFQLVRAVYQAGFFYIAISELTSDLQSIVRGSDSVHKVTNEEFLANVKEQIPRIKSLKNRRVLIGALDVLLLWSLGIFWDYGIRIYSYIIPLASLVIYFNSISFFFIRFRKKWLYSFSAGQPKRNNKRGGWKLTRRQTSTGVISKTDVASAPAEFVVSIPPSQIENEI